jgi:hypothetical protein
LIKNVVTFEGYFDRMGYPELKLEKLNILLTNAVKNSLKKNYHGGLEDSFPLPTPN